MLPAVADGKLCPKPSVNIHNLDSLSGIGICSNSVANEVIVVLVMVVVEGVASLRRPERKCLANIPCGYCCGREI